jgi:hypothetical protein
MSQKSWLDYDDPTHPLQITLRTYALSLSLSLGPSLIPFISSCNRTSFPALKHVLRREFGLDGFAFAITVCVGGGAAIRKLWHNLEQARTISPMSARAARRQCTYLQTLKLTSYQRTFLANIFSSSLGVLLLQAGYRRSRRLKGGRNSSNFGMPHPQASTGTNRALSTLDLTLLLLVRAMDAVLQAFIHKTSQPEQLERGSDKSGHILFTEPSSTRGKLSKANAKPDKLVRDLISRIDAFVFWACSARYIPYYLCIRYLLTSVDEGSCGAFSTNLKGIHVRHHLLIPLAKWPIRLLHMPGFLAHM